MRGILLIMFSLGFSSCWEFQAPASFPAGEVEGYVPVFDSDPVLDVTYEEYQAILNPGKILYLSAVSIAGRYWFRHSCI